MASVLSRRPLVNRTLPNNNTPSKPPRVVSGSKRARSPEHVASQQSLHTQKRARATPSVVTPRPQKPAQATQITKTTKRQQQEAEFRDKYSKAFPSWKFYFDSEKPLAVNKIVLRTRVLSLKGQVQDYFDASITHFITDRTPPAKSSIDKENKRFLGKANSLKSPIKISRKTSNSRDILQNAVDRELKIWTAVKLDSVLTRCLESTPKPSTTRVARAAAPASQKHNLSKLLEAEKIHGTTERDPDQKRLNYQYFGTDSYFVLLEDMSQELATLAVHEYPIPNNNDTKSRKPWPVLHCHPRSRNPFIPFDEREKRRWEKQQKAEKDEEEQRAQRKKHLRLEALRRKTESKRVGDLRRTLSLGNLHRRLSHPMADCVDLDAEVEDYESANASGYLASGGAAYIAASGNSVGITSTTGTTSAASRSLRNMVLAPEIAERMKHHVITSRKVACKNKDDTHGNMGPPAIPDRPGLLKKSKSMNTMKLPKRDEGTKPGYCENCRLKFDDFNEHLVSSKHTAYAANPANFEALDFVLRQLERQKKEEVEREGQTLISHLRARCRFASRKTQM